MATLTRTHRIVDTDECGAPITEPERWLIAETPGGRIGQRFCGPFEACVWFNLLAPHIEGDPTWWVSEWFPDPPER